MSSWNLRDWASLESHQRLLNENDMRRLDTAFVERPTQPVSQSDQHLTKATSQTPQKRAVSEESPPFLARSRPKYRRRWGKKSIWTGWERRDVVTNIAAKTDVSVVGVEWDAILRCVEAMAWGMIWYRYAGDVGGQESNM